MGKIFIFKNQWKSFCPLRQNSSAWNNGNSSEPKMIHTSRWHIIVTDNPESNTFKTYSCKSQKSNVQQIFNSFFFHKHATDATNTNKLYLNILHLFGHHETNLPMSKLFLGEHSGGCRVVNVTSYPYSLATLALSLSIYVMHSFPAKRNTMYSCSTKYYIPLNIHNN